MQLNLAAQIFIAAKECNPVCLLWCVWGGGRGRGALMGHETIISFALYIAYFGCAIGYWGARGGEGGFAM